MEYQFTLRYQLEDPNHDPAELVELLGAAGCTDALVGIGLPGRIALEFARAARSADGAVSSALRDVRKAIPSARLIEITPDWVGLSDLAQLLGMSRQNMRKLMLSHPATFPAPVHEGSTTVWHLIDILLWLDARGGYPVGATLLELAKVTQEVNSARESHRIDGSASRSIGVLAA